MEPKKNSAKRLSYTLMALFVLLGFLFAAYNFHRQELSRGLLGLVSPVFLLIPCIIRLLKIGHPYKLYSLLYAFCILAFDLGCVFMGYEAFPMLDKAVHFLSGIVFTILGYCVYLFLTRPLPQKQNESWIVGSTYALFFSIFIAVVWEIAEFSGFILTGHDSQHTLTTGVFDTMGDLICCMIGSILSVGSYILYVKSGVRLLTASVIEELSSLLSDRRPAADKKQPVTAVEKIYESKTS